MPQKATIRSKRICGYLSGYLGIKPKVIHPLYLQCHTENLIQEKLHELL